MEVTLTELLDGLTEIYSRQKVLYGKLAEIALWEAKAIKERDMLGLIDLQQVEGQLMEQVQVLDDAKAQLKEVLLSKLPGRRLTMDQLACAAEPAAYIAHHKIVSEINNLLGEIEQTKRNNAYELSQTLQLNRHGVGA
ncbi:flagellar export chaperone FlgN [Dethiobacter alkaliphilus]|uniref:FlgN family protein n=1 Tax=Dethiobacter alkaliphilus AHT 1 TaxID=555088 RepID=C0GJI6_DETAL|nr:flagellar export chaperone FlgN [Dethiobacter alkaliphilus]EEG76533.1 hypothetical protein DealDRAFT_2645 [Dethiobacter alkaliphilus AHT 1]